MFKSKIIINIGEYNFLTFNVKKTFKFSRQIFAQDLIFLYSDLKYYIWIEINILSYTIKEVLS